MANQSKVTKSTRSSKMIRYQRIPLDAIDENGQIVKTYFTRDNTNGARRFEGSTMWIMPHMSLRDLVSRAPVIDSDEETDTDINEDDWDVFSRISWLTQASNLFDVPSTPVRPRPAPSAAAAMVAALMTPVPMPSPISVMLTPVMRPEIIDLTEDSDADADADDDDVVVFRKA
jgi:hypothetical protein